MPTLLDDKKDNWSTSLADREDKASQDTKENNQPLRDTEEKPEDGYYKRDEGGKKRTIKSFFSNRRRAAYGIAGTGGIGAIIISFFVFVGPFKIPSIVGDFENDLSSSRMTRRIVERKFEKMLVKYAVLKEAGKIGKHVKPGSALDKLYKMFDSIDINKIIEQQNGIRYFNKNGVVHVYHHGKDIGTIDADDLKKLDSDYDNLKKNNRAFRKDAAQVVTRTFPIFRMGTLSGTLRVWILKSGFVRGFGAPKEDKNKTKAENVADEITKPALEQSTETAVSELENAVDCLGGGDKTACSGLERGDQPIETSDPHARSGLGRGGTSEKENPSAKAIQEEISTEVDALKNKPGGNTDIMTKVLEKVLAKIVGETAGKAIAESIPIIGWIDIAAQLSHAADEINDKQLFQQTLVLLREQQAGSIGATWLGFADNIKQGSMTLSFVSGLNERLTGHTNAEMIRSMYGYDGQGVPVNPKIGSRQEDLLSKDLAYQIYGVESGDLYGFVMCRSIDDYKVVNTANCLTHLVLWAWYHTVSKVLAAIGDVAAAILTALPMWLMEQAFGKDWQAVLFQKAVHWVLDIFGYFGYDPTAVGPKLVNGIGVGIDVIFNRYMQTNLGARDITNDPSAAAALMEADQQYRENIAALPLRDRLFSLDVSSSLINRLAAAAPSNATPGTLAASIIAPIKSLPSALFSVVSGKSSAALPGPAQSAAVDGVAQFGGNLAEIEADIPSELTTQQVSQISDVKCPANAPGFFNNCQAYKEIMQGAMCYDIKNPCPQYQQ